MEFWGVEVKAGQPHKVLLEPGKLLHISQAALGEGKKDKGNDFVLLRMKIDEKQYVLGTLSAENTPQLTFDLVFEREFELSHGWKNGSVYFCGYKADDPSWEGEDDSDEDEGHPIDTPEDVKLEPKVEKAKPGKSKADVSKPETSAKLKVTLVEPRKDDESDEDDDNDDNDDDDNDEEDDSDDFDDEGEELPDIGAGDSDEDEDTDDDEDTSDEDEETPKKADLGKKRPIESPAKTPAPVKKAKFATPQKTVGKKEGGVRIATPYPSKQAGKANKAKEEQILKSSGQVVSCSSCSRTFNSENALQSHTKAKHSGK